MITAYVDDWCRLYANGRTGARQRGTRVQWPQPRRSWHQRLHSGSPPLYRQPGLVMNAWNNCVVYANLFATLGVDEWLARQSRHTFELLRMLWSGCGRGKPIVWPFWIIRRHVATCPNHQFTDLRVLDYQQPVFGHMDSGSAHGAQVGTVGER